ncbi:MAG: helix-turn-helix transcriptional regulator [Actinobacteria bacterium]|nr:helix-turn-helix transcriptional regulator [Actinomycetota bacterium]
MEEFDRRVATQLGRRIRRRRHFLDLSQEILAERSGIHRTQFSLYENGRRMPLASSLIKLAAALEISVDQLVVGIEWPVPGPPLRVPLAGHRDD